MADFVVVDDGRVVLEEFGMRRLRFRFDFEIEFDCEDEVGIVACGVEHVRCGMMRG